MKDVAFDEGPMPDVRLRPNLPLVGRRLGRKVGAVRDAMRDGDYEELPGGGIVVAGETLAPEEVLRGERIELEGWASAEDESVSVAIDTTLTDALRAEGRALDLIRELNGMRKDAGLSSPTACGSCSPRPSRTCSATRSGSRRTSSPCRSTSTTSSPSR